MAALTLVALGLRLRGFRDWWLNPDEGIYFSLATWPDWGAFWAELWANVHPPLFYLVVRGASVLGDELEILRAPALVAGVVAVPVFHLATRALAGRTAGVAAAFLIALSPGCVLLSQVIRPYTTLVLALAVAAAAFAHFVQRRTTRALVVFGSALFVAAWIHYSAALAAAASAAVGALLLATRTLCVRDVARLALAHVPAAVVLLAFAFLHVSARLEPLREAQATWLAHYLHGDAASLLGGWVGFFRYWFGIRYDALAALLLALGTVAALLRRRPAFAAWIVACVVLASVLARSGFYPLGGTRHTAWLLAALVPGIAYGASQAWAPRAWPAKAAGVALLLAALVFPDPLRFVLGTASADPMIAPERVTPRWAVESARDVLERSGPGLVVMDLQTYFTLMPLLHEVRVSLEEGEEDRLSHFVLGASDVIVSHDWRLRAAPENPGGADHVLGFLHHADTVLPELEIAQRPRGLLVFAGWGAPFYRPLARGTTEGPERMRCVDELRIHPGVGWASLRPARCLASLRRDLSGRPPPRKARGARAGGSRP